MPESILTKRVSWQSEGVDMPDLDFDRVERWLTEVGRRHGRILDQLGYVFCNDDRILDVNRQFLNHDYYTDIITFDYCRGRMLRGDMYISLDTVATNADGVGADYGEELLRVIVHGVLHLCGIDDKAPGARAIMESHENDALAIWPAIDSI